MEVMPVAKAAVVVYGDSIATGGWPQELGWEADARGCRTLHDDSGALARLTKYGADTIWIAIGTNDYYLSQWTPAAFGQAYGTLLDGLRGSLVIAQTPLLRKAEPANRLGATLDDYRAEILSACRGRHWVTCVDGRSLVPLSLLPDGVHPSPQGDAVYAANVRKLNLSP